LFLEKIKIWWKEKKKSGKKGRKARKMRDFLFFKTKNPSFF